MTIIDDNTVVVNTSAELKNILENNNTYNYIYFGNNITLTSGIIISSTKTNITIDGTYDNVTYEFTDMKSTGAADTIRVNSVINKVTVKNMKITGYNYYGVIYVPEEAKYKDVIIEYNNINYLGPQISFHPYGLTRFIDVNIEIQDNYAVGNEVAECNKIEIGGISTITHNSTGNSSFWFRNSNPYLKILPNSTVHFTSVNRELIYGITNLEFDIGHSSSFYITTKNGMGYGTFGTGITTLEENSLLNIKQTSRNGSYPTWYSYGSITLNNGSTLEIINDFTSITSGNYNIYFNGSSTGFYLNNPEKVILYNKVANVLYTNNTVPFNFNFNRINLFDSAIDISSDITKDTLPTSWYKNTLSNITGTFTNSKTTITSSNFTESELTTLPSLDKFIINNKKIISVGDFVLHVDALTDTDTVIKGSTLSNSSILIEYETESAVVKVGEDGIYSYTLPNTLPIGTKITFNTKLYNEPIYNTKVIEIVYSGELVVDDATKIVKFILEPISINPILCPKESELVINVTDSRIHSSDWKLYASINHDLSNGDDVLEKSIIIKKDDEITVLDDEPKLIYTGTDNGGVTKTTNVTFKEDEGILLSINNPIKNNMVYTSVISYSIEE